MTIEDALIALEVARDRAAQERRRADKLEAALRYIAEKDLDPVTEANVAAGEWHKHVRYRHLHEFARDFMARLRPSPWTAQSAPVTERQEVTVIEADPLDCPFCGGTVLFVGDIIDTNLAIMCSTCGAAGPGAIFRATEEDSYEKAVTAWNRRASEANP